MNDTTYSYTLRRRHNYGNVAWRFFGPSPQCATMLHCPVKRSEMPIVTFAAQVQIETESLDVGLLRTRQSETPIGRMGGVIDIEWFARAVS